MALFGSRFSSPFNAFLAAITFAGGTIAPLVPAADYYVNPDLGLDTNNGLTPETAWATFNKAISTVTVAGKKVYFAAGSYEETAQLPKLAVGVSLFGPVGSADPRDLMNAAVLNVNYRTSGGQATRFFNLIESAYNVDGLGQSVSYIRFNGSYRGSYGDSAWEYNSTTGYGQADSCFYIRGRSNVSVHHCVFENFEQNICTFSGEVVENDSQLPLSDANIAKGNSFHHNYSIDCSTSSDITGGVGSGHLQWGGQDGIEIAYNIAIQTGRKRNPKSYLYDYANTPPQITTATGAAGQNTITIPAALGVDVTGWYVRGTNIAGGMTVSAGGAAATTITLNGNNAGAVTGNVVFIKQFTNVWTFAPDGYLFKYYRLGYSKNENIHHNKLVKAPKRNNGQSYGYDIIWEMWNSLGGTRIYKNDIGGNLDLAYGVKGTAGFAYDVYENMIGFPFTQQFDETGINLEYAAPDTNVPSYARNLVGVRIRKNVIRNVKKGIFFVGHVLSASCSEIDVISNIFINSGIFTVANAGALSKVNVLGNTAFAGQLNKNAAPYNAYDMFDLNLGGVGSTMTEVLIQNNLLIGAQRSVAYFWGSGGTIDNIKFITNATYGNGNNAIFIDESAATTAKITNRVSTGNVVLGAAPLVNPQKGANPNGVVRAKDYKLLANLIGTPHALLTEDFEGKPRSATAPSIGALEFS